MQTPGSSMYPSSQGSSQVYPEGSPVALDAPAVRHSWRVKDCLLCSWYDLPSPLSIDEMWRLLVEGRYCDARRIE